MKDIQDNENNSSVNKQVTQTLINEEQRNVLSGNLEQKSVIPENNNEWRRNLPNTSRGILDNDIIRYLEENYKTKAELFASQIRLENAIKEIEILRQKNLELENELDEDEDQSGIIGALNHIPEWLQPAIGSILKSEKIQNFIIGLIPEEQKN